MISNTIRFNKTIFMTDLHGQFTSIVETASESKKVKKTMLQSETYERYFLAVGFYRKKPSLENYLSKKH